MGENKKRVEKWKCGIHLDPLDRVHLLLEIITTDKTATALSREFGVSRSAIAYHRKRLKSAIYRERKRRGNPYLSYKKDGSISY